MNALKTCFGFVLFEGEWFPCSGEVQTALLVAEEGHKSALDGGREARVVGGIMRHRGHLTCLDHALHFVP
jgi:hypothetical protein